MNMMKTQNTLLLAAAAVTVLNFQSCSKYEDGPAFSLRTKTSRLVGEWEVVRVDGQNSNAYFGPGYTYYFEFESDGDFEMKYDYSYNGITYSYSYGGEWEWEDDKASVEVQMDGYGGITEYEIKKLTNSELTLVNKTDNQEIELERIIEFNLFTKPLYGAFFMRKNKLNISFDQEIPKLLFENNISVIFSTYQAGRIMIIGSLDGYNIHQIPIAYKKPMGIAIEENRIAVASLDEISFFTYNDDVITSIKPNEENMDRMYLYRASYNTSSLDIHDIDFDQSGLWGVNTLFSCLCKFTLAYNFSPRWKPYFITEITPEDRCHLNGLALENSSPKYVSALSSTDTKGGWRKT